MMRKNSLSPTKLEYGNDSLVHINSQLSNNSDLLNLIPIGSNKSIQIDETQRENETLTLEKRNSCISINESYYDKRDSRLNSFSKKDESTRINRAHSLQKVSKDRNQSQNFKPTHTIVLGRAGIQYRKDLAKKKKAKEIHHKKQLEEIELQKHKKLQEQEQQAIIRSKSRRIIREVQRVLKLKVEESRKNMHDMRKIQAKNSFTEDLAFFESSDDEDYVDDEDKHSLKILRKKLLQKQGNNELVLHRVITSTSSSTFSRMPQQVPPEPELVKEQSTNTKKENKNKIKKIAYEMTDDAVKKEKFFKIVKDVLKGGLLEKMRKAEDKQQRSVKANEASRVNVKSKLAQIKFIEKCIQEKVLALPMLNKIKDKKLILNNYRMNDGIAKALHDALIELQDLVEVVSFESNDISDKALEVILKGVKGNKHITTLQIQKNVIAEGAAEMMRQLLGDNTDLEVVKDEHEKSNIK